MSVYAVQSAKRPSPTPCGLAVRMAEHTLATKSSHIGKSAARYQATVSRFLGGSDDRQASPETVSGLAGVPGSNDA